MKILFICGALEPGRDGVGDYTRRLAIAVQQAGHQAAIVALCDPFVVRETMADQVADNGHVHTLRLPAVTIAADRYHRAQAWALEFAPAWISLQFVPYAFHPKGLPFGLPAALQKILHNCTLHIMFHETWIGTENRRQLKRRITAFLQQRIIRRIINFLQPAVVHTQLPVSLDKLRNIFPSIQPLPLFSNIEVAGSPVLQPPQLLRVGFFSQAGNSEAIIKFLQQLAGNAAIRNRQIELIFIGGDPDRMKVTGDVFADMPGFSKPVIYTGFLSPEGISAALQSCSLGITLVPRHALGKSGSVAAFLQHGIPVAAPIVHDGYDQADIGFFSADLCAAILLHPALDALERAGSAAGFAPQQINLQAVSKKFLDNIGATVAAPVQALA